MKQVDRQRSRTGGKPSPVFGGSSCVVLAAAIGALLVAGARAQAPPEASSGPNAVRNEVATELATLQARLTVLRGDPAVAADHWADAAIFVKGIVWALDFEPAIDVQNRQLIQKALRRARERVDAFAEGQHAWTGKKGRSVRGFVSGVDGSTQPYGLVVPSGYDPARPIRLDVVLHGSRKAAGIGELAFINDFDDGDETGRPAPAVDYIEVHPMGRLGENAYRFEGETDVDEAIEAVCRNYRVDRTRIVLRGSSLGGVGTWQLGLKRPDRYAALGPSAGPVDTIEFASSPWPHFVRLDPLTPWQKTMLHMVDAIDYTANAAMVPVVAAMGDKDPYFSSHRLIEKTFEREGIPFVGIVDRGAGHGLSPKAFQEQLRLLGEAAARGLDPSPRHIRFVTWTLKFNRCHWIEILGLDRHYERAEIEARVADDGSITVGEPQNINRFALHLLKPQVASPAFRLTVGGSKIALPDRNKDATGTVVVVRRDGKWEAQGASNEAALTGKRPGLQGPIDDAFATRFLCVRGTGQAWNPAVGAWADASLKRFTSEWRRHYHGDLPVKADTDVTQDDVRQSNLILFGDPGSNRWIREILPKLPIGWTRDTVQVGDERHRAADHGLALIVPNPLPGAERHYVVLNSGHTYHDKELRFSYMVFPRLGDWAIVKVGENPPDAPAESVAESVLVSGFFDEGWANPFVPSEKR